MRSDKVISALPKIIYKELVEQMSKESVDCDCPVCMESFEIEQEVIVLPCAHFFHVDCSKGWLMVSLIDFTDEAFNFSFFPGK